MDWEANLAAIIKCTDANLEQQFRQFADMTSDLTTYSPCDYGRNSAAAAAGSGGNGFGGCGGGLPFQQQQQNSMFDDSSNIGAAYFRESMASNLRRSGESYGSGDGGGEGFSPSRPTGMPTSFSGELRRRQERKRSEEAPNLRSTRPSDDRYDNNNNDDQENSAEFDEEFGHSSIYKTSSSVQEQSAWHAAPMDRLRVEVCANDRQMHTLEQVQSKLRQELTTQKDIGFHLQSVCGKDESWRMQAENQLLELRQLVAAIREQGNSLHATSQEKLSRAELIVQFNASIEPIKAHFQANLQHQAQQIAEIARTTSSSSLLLDALTQRVDRGLADEITDLRDEVYALKSHVSKMGTMLDGDRSAQQQQQEQERAEAAASKPALLVRDPAGEAERAAKGEEKVEPDGRA